MNGNHPQLVFDLTRLAREEEMRRASNDRLLAEARGARGRRIGIVTASRRVFGGAIISLGQAVRGERIDTVEGPAVGTATLRVAR